MLPIKKPVHLQKMGSSEGAGPESHTEIELSRALDLLYAAQQMNRGAEFVDQVMSLLPYKLRMDMTWCRWRYQQ